MKKTLWSSLSALVVSLFLCCIMAMPVMAAGDLDGLTGGGSSQSDDSDGGGGAGALGGALKDYEPIDEENMKEAQAIAKPITNLIGKAVGIIVLVVGAGIFFVTACDLAYIAVPFTRSLLTSKYQIVSDEALQVVQGGMQGGMGGMQGGMNGMVGMGSPMGGMGSPMGGMGGMGSPMGGMGAGMNGMGGMQGGQMSVKSAISQYFKKRIVFIVIFTIAMILLTSSALTGVGINLAALLFKVVDKVNSIINDVNI